MIRERLLEWLGINRILGKLNVFNERTIELVSKLDKLNTQIGIHNRALARVIAKLDPLYGDDEISPGRRAESDKIGELVLAKLRGETEMQQRIP